MMLTFYDLYSCYIYNSKLKDEIPYQKVENLYVQMKKYIRSFYFTWHNLMIKFLNFYKFHHNFYSFFIS